MMSSQFSFANVLATQIYHVNLVAVSKAWLTQSTKTNDFLWRDFSGHNTTSFRQYRQDTNLLEAGTSASFIKLTNCTQSVQNIAY